MCGTRAEYRRVARVEEDHSIEKIKRKEMTDERIISLAAESADLGVRRWLITGGGEPFVRREATMTLMGEIKRLGMWGNVNTNGTLLSEQEVENVVRLGWDMVMFSLDSNDPEVHDRLRNSSGAFEKAIKALELFLYWKERLGVGTPKIVFNSVLFRGNYSRLSELVEMAGRLGCEDITFIPLIKFDDITPGLELRDSELTAFQTKIDAVVEASRRNCVSTNIESFREHPVDDTSKMDEIILKDLNPAQNNHFCETPCFEPYLNMVIQMTGQVSPCCMLFNSKENVKEKSLEEVWHGSFFANLRSMLTSGDLPEGCSTCVYQQVIRTKGIREALRSEIHDRHVFGEQ